MASALQDAYRSFEAANTYFNSQPTDTYKFQLTDEAEKSTWGYHERVGYAGSLQVIAALGNERDAQELLDKAMTLTGTSTQRRASQLVVAAMALLVRAEFSMLEIEQLVSSYAGLENGDVHSSLLIEAARYGSRSAYDDLVDIIAINRNVAGWSDTVAGAAIAVLFSRENEHVLDLALDFVRLHHSSIAPGAGSEPVSDTLAGVTALLHTNSAYLYAAAFASGDQRKVLNTGFLPSGSTVFLAPAFENPIDVANHSYGVLGGELRDVHRSWHKFTVCSLLKARGAEDIAEIEDDLWRLYYDWYPFIGGNNEFMRQRMPAYLVGAARAYCRIDETAARIYDWSRRVNDVVLPSYIEATAFTATEHINEFLAGGEKAAGALSMLDFYSVDEVREAVNQLGNAAGKEVRDLLAQKQVLAPNLVARINVSMHTDHQYLVMRDFDPPSGKTAEPLWMGLEATLAVRALNDRRFVGVTLSTLRHAVNGLAAKISGRLDRSDAYLENAGRRLIDNVRIRRASGSQDLNFIQTSRAGQHIFEIPLEAFQRDAVIDVYFASVLNLDPISVPLASTRSMIDEEFRSHR
ncbi:MAG: hypothetical protein AAFY73_06505 [Pseudomonadota bacterium]